MAHLRLGRLLATLTLAACSVGGDEQPSWEEFLASTEKERDTGLYIVDNDHAIGDTKQLREFYDTLYEETHTISASLSAKSSALTAQSWREEKQLWPLSNDYDASTGPKGAQNIRFCVSDEFGENKATVVAAAMDAATNGWSKLCNVGFVYKPEFDATCNIDNPKVAVPIRPADDSVIYLGRAFFPNSKKDQREMRLKVNEGMWPLANIIGHEFGHILGFRHEHLRGGIVTQKAECKAEVRTWMAITQYDPGSIMHYMCQATGDLQYSTLDAEGCRAVYGAPGDKPPTLVTGGTLTREFTGSLNASEFRVLDEFDVAPNSTFVAEMTGVGDPDLYVRFGERPVDTKRRDCAAHQNGPEGRCDLTVPSGITKAYVAVDAWEQTASFSVKVTFTKP